LEARDPRPLGPDMLDKEQTPAGLQHAADLGQRHGRVGHSAEDQGADRSVERRIFSPNVLRAI